MTTNKNPTQLHSRHIRFSRINLLVVVFIFALIGSIALIHSLAAPNPNLQGDLNNDNLVNGLDLSLLLGDFNTTNPAADINGDGHVNGIDLSILLSHWGETISSSLTFESVTNWARPDPGSPSAASTDGWRLVPFSTKAGLDSAISNMQGHDYIYYNGTGVMTINNSGTGEAYSIHDKNPSSPVVIDFGVSRDIWNPSLAKGNYVKITYTGTSQFDALSLYNDSNLRIFGGEFATGNYGYDALRIFAPFHDMVIEDSYLSMSGGNEAQIAATDHSTGAALEIYNLTYRVEAARFSMNPAWDNHLDKGTGFHGLQLHGGGTLRDSTFAVYAHDPLKPGEASAGQTWPEGGGGSACEPGMDTPGVNNNITIYCKGENLLMIPNGTNPGSNGNKQTGGNVIDAWGNAPFNNFDFKWIEGINTTGSVFHGSGGSWYKSTPAILVEHGRHTNTNQQPNLGNIGTNPYQTTDPTNGASLNINYQDIQ